MLPGKYGQAVELLQGHESCLETKTGFFPTPPDQLKKADERGTSLPILQVHSGPGIHVDLENVLLYR
jgi:hypothetical protein